MPNGTPASGPCAPFRSSARLFDDLVRIQVVKCQHLRLTLLGAREVRPRDRLARGLAGRDGCGDLNRG
jgi:hypothetical protein